MFKYMFFEVLFIILITLAFGVVYIEQEDYLIQFLAFLPSAFILLLYYIMITKDNHNKFKKPSLEGVGFKAQLLFTYPLFYFIFFIVNQTDKTNFEIIFFISTTWLTVVSMALINLISQFKEFDKCYKSNFDYNNMNLESLFKVYIKKFWKEGLIVMAASTLVTAIIILIALSTEFYALLLLVVAVLGTIIQLLKKSVNIVRDQQNIKYNSETMDKLAIVAIVCLFLSLVLTMFFSLVTSLYMLSYAIVQVICTDYILVDKRF